MINFPHHFLFIYGVIMQLLIIFIAFAIRFIFAQYIKIHYPDTWTKIIPPEYLPPDSFKALFKYKGPRKRPDMTDFINKDYVYSLGDSNLNRLLFALKFANCLLLLYFISFIIFWFIWFFRI